MIVSDNALHLTSRAQPLGLFWRGDSQSLSFDEEGIKAKLLELDATCFLIREGNRLGLTTGGNVVEQARHQKQDLEVITLIPPVPTYALGNPDFKSFYGTRFAYYAGSMANGISSADMVIALGKNGFMGSFGAGGVLPAKLEETIQHIQRELPDGPFAFNLIHNPFEEAMEKQAVDLFLKHRVTTIEASAYMNLTPYVVYYRAVGLSLNNSGQLEINNKIIAKISRKEVATKFLNPAPEKHLKQLVEQRLISTTQAELAEKVPMADDVTVEADSGGHTDNRPLVSLLPSVISLRNELQEIHQFDHPVRVGAAGGIGTPESTLAAFMMGADYVVTGSVNQGCVEAGTSDHVRRLLSQVEMADVIMAPAMDMFEMGGKLQVMKRGSLFAMRAQKLADLYKDYRSIDDISPSEYTKLETQIFQRPINEVWEETINYFNKRDPEQIKKARENPRKKMALLFRWYLGLASHWANAGVKGREMDYQIWCGPSMGAFNDWTRGSYLESPEQRRVVDVALHLMTGAAYLFRLQHLKTARVHLPSRLNRYTPQPL